MLCVHTVVLSELHCMGYDVNPCLYCTLFTAYENGVINYDTYLVLLRPTSALM